MCDISIIDGNTILTLQKNRFYRERQRRRPVRRRADKSQTRREPEHEFDRQQKSGRHARTARSAGRLVARVELPRRKRALSFGQPAPARTAHGGRHQEKDRRPLGHRARTELRLHASRPRHQQIRSRHDLHFRPGPRRQRHARAGLARRQLQRGLSERQSGL